ncbi:MAG: NAD-dependent succinate-semialdehyde dehydrogenase [Rhizobiales bacterium]|nr:NAD-dependent succinate-semialdehyde dehydrogenase [Hyphomicrobiales bacterium]
MQHSDLSLYIAGEWRGLKGRSGEDVINPATEQSLGSLPHANREDLEDAIASATIAFEKWRTTPAAARAKILVGAARLLRERSEQIARIITLEQGKPIRESRVEINFAAEIIDWYAEEGKRAYGRLVPSRLPAVQQAVHKVPVGPVAAFTPWNVPATTPARKIAGALAAGCTCILKPSEETPATALAIARAFEDAGLPAGVLNIVFGVPSEISNFLIASPKISKISFTGSIAVGKKLTGLASENMTRVTMELGGHAPVIVCEDADAEVAAESIAINKYRNAGQICIAPSRFFVHEAVHDKFLAKFSEVSSKLVVKNGIEEDSEIGALANSRRLDAMESFVSNAERSGARLQCGGRRVGNAGFFFPPTVISDVSADDRMMTDEIFGPVVPIRRFTDLDETIFEANKLRYGLAAYVYTKSQARAALLSDQIQAGMIGVNHTFIFTPETPFGGVKDSGYGSEGGIEGLEAYLSPKFVSTLPQ